MPGALDPDPDWVSLGRNVYILRGPGLVLSIYIFIQATSEPETANLKPSRMSGFEDPCGRRVQAREIWELEVLTPIAEPAPPVSPWARDWLLV